MHLCIQGCTKRWASSCVKLGEKLRFVHLRQAGERNFFTSFSQNLGTFKCILGVKSCITFKEGFQTTNVVYQALIDSYKANYGRTRCILMDHDITKRHWQFLRLKGCVNSPLQWQLTTKHIDLFVWTEFKSTWSTCADVRASRLWQKERSWGRLE